MAEALGFFMSWLLKIADTQEWLANKGIAKEFIDFAMRDTWHPKMKKWIAIQLNKEFKKEIERIKLQEQSDPKSKTSLPNINEFIDSNKSDIIEISDMIKWRDRHREPLKKKDINKYSIEEALAESVEWNKEMKERRGEGHPDFYTYYRTEDGKIVKDDLGDGFFMVEVPLDDLQNEGAIMQHCVGDGEYDEAVEEEETFIYSLRDSRGWPHATVEVTDKNFDARKEGVYDTEAWESDPDNWITDSAGNIVDFDYEGSKDSDTEPLWSVEQIQGKQDKPPISKYRKYIRQWLSGHPEFNLSKSMKLTITDEEELIKTIYENKDDEKIFSECSKCISDENNAKLREDILGNDKNWSSSILAKVLKNLITKEDEGNSDFESIFTITSKYLSQDYPDVVRMAAVDLLSDLYEVYHGSMGERELAINVLKQETNPKIAAELLYLLKETIYNPLDEGKSGAVVSAFPEDILPLAIEVYNRFSDYEPPVGRKELDMQILGTALHEVSPELGAKFVERAMQSYGPISTYEIRSVLHRLPTRHFWEIWNKVSPQYQETLADADSPRYYSGNYSGGFNTLRPHETALNWWRDYKKQLKEYERLKRDREDSESRGWTINAPPPQPPKFPDYDPKWEDEPTTYQKVSVPRGGKYYTASKTAQATGTCFRDAAKYIRGTDKTLVHGLVIHPATGKKMWHAWVEHEGMAEDCTLPSNKGQSCFTVPVEKYYELFQPTNMKRYTDEQAMIGMVRARSPEHPYGHWGPWHDEKEAITKNWLTVIASMGIQSTTFIGPDGIKYIGLIGDTYDRRQEIARLGFKQYRDASNKFMWIMELDKFLANPRAQAGLRSLGVAMPISPPVAPSMPRPQSPQNWMQKAVKVWYLATMLTDGRNIATTKIDEGWKWVDQQGNEGAYFDDEVSEYIKTVRDANGKPIGGHSPEELFAQLSQEDTAVTQPEAPGRIPRSRISEHQAEVENSFINTDKNIMMNALAGTGKTTMLRDLASYKDPKEKWLYLVFNKKNQIESSTGKGKFPNGVEVLTSHAFLGRVLGRTAELGAIETTELWQDRGERMSKMLDNMLEFDNNTFPMKLKFAAKKIIKQLTSLSKAYAIRPDDQDAPTKIMNIVRQYGIDMDISTETTNQDKDYTPQLIDKTLDLLHFSLPGKAPDQELRGQRDHDDTLWYAAIQDVKWPHYDVVLADEVQDFNRCQMVMLQKLSEAGARVVAVGDPNQSLYMFRGADAHAFDNIQNVISAAPTGGVSHSLPTNYRSGKKIIEFVNQNTKVKNLQAGRDHDGLVTTDIEYDSAVSGLREEWVKNHSFKEQTAVIARMNKPLVGCALDLMKNGMNFVIIGRDFSQELTQHVEKVIGVGRKQTNYPIDQLSEVLESFKFDLVQRWKDKISKSAQLQEISDTTDSLINVLEHLANMNYRDDDLNMRVPDSVSFIKYLRTRFGGVNLDTVQGAQELAQKNPKSYVTLTTAHRSKGLEFDRVFIVEPEMFPHPKAKTPEALEQEDNAWYVALTRAMQELHILVTKKA